MQINVAQLLREHIGASRNCSIDQIDDLTDYPIYGEMRLLRTDRGILASGIVETKVRLECSRCLTELEYPVRLKIEEEYLPTIDLATGISLTLPEEPSIFTIDESHILDLSEAVRQYTLMAIPMKPLCRADCAGLCPDCGHNLNLGPCRCVLPPDSKWAELLKLVPAEKMPQNQLTGKD